MSSWTVKFNSQEAVATTTKVTPPEYPGAIGTVEALTKTHRFTKRQTLFRVDDELTIPHIEVEQLETVSSFVNVRGELRLDNIRRVRLDYASVEAPSTSVISFCGLSGDVVTVARSKIVLKENAQLHITVTPGFTRLEVDINIGKGGKLVVDRIAKLREIKRINVDDGCVMILRKHKDLQVYADDRKMTELSSSIPLEHEDDLSMLRTLKSI